MRILHTSEFYAPSVGGAQEVTRQISERLAGRGHDVTVATTALPERTESSIGGVRVVGFDVAGNAARGITGDVDAYRRFVSEGGFDVVMNYAAQQWTTDALLPVLDELPARTVLAPCGFSGLHDPAWKAYFEALPDALRRYDRLVFHSETYRDARFADEHGLTSGTVIPNGADERDFGWLPSGRDARERLGLSPDVPVLLTVGSHTGLKGHVECIELMRRLRAPRAVLIMLANTVGARGCRPSCRARAAALAVRSRGRRRVAMGNLTGADRLAAFAAADAFVFASRIECSPLVLFEAAASGVPFVTSDVGNAREIAEWTGGGIVARTAETGGGLVRVDVANMAARVDDLLDDPGRRRQLGQAGRREWERRFTWERIADRYEQLYRSLLGAAAGSTAT